MESIELLSKQLEQNQKQNIEEHRELSSKIDKMLTEIHVLYSERNLTEEKLENLEEGQNQIKETVNKIEERVKNLEESDLKRNHARGLLYKSLGVAATLGAIVGVILKMGWI